jgi:hypothetical protein
MLIVRFILVIVAVAISVWVSPAQQPVGYPDSVYVSASGRRRGPTEIDAMKRIVDSQRTNARFEEMDSIRDQMSESLPAPAPQPRTVRSGKAVISAAEYLMPAKIRSRYADFLKEPGTGIVRLLSGAPCEIPNEKERSSDSCPADIVPGRGMFYSFRQKNYVDYSLADVGIKDNLIFSLGSLNAGILVKLGETPVQNISDSTPGMKYLLEFVPATSVEAAADQSRRLEKGIGDGGFRYSNVVKLDVDVTYALRVVAYRPFYNVAGRDGKDKSPIVNRVFPLANDARRDIVVAFRLVGKQSNGDLIMLWKELRNVESPEVLLPRPPIGK